MCNANQSATIALLAAALAKLQSKIQAAALDAQNPFLHNRYASLGSVIEAARPALAENDLAICQMPINTDAGVGVETILMHKSGEFIGRKIILPLGEEKGKSSAQVAGSIITYLRRYSLASFLGIYAEEDDDGQVSSPSPSQSRSFNPPPTSKREPPPLDEPPVEILKATEKQMKLLFVKLKEFGWLEKNGDLIPQGKEALWKRWGYRSRTEITAVNFAPILEFFSTIPQDRLEEKEEK